MNRCNIVRMRAFKVISHIYSFRQNNNAIFQHYLNKYRMSLSTLPTTQKSSIQQQHVFFTKTKNNLPTQGFSGIYAKQKTTIKKGPGSPLTSLPRTTKRFFKKKQIHPSQSRRGPPKVEGPSLHSTDKRFVKNVIIPPKSRGTRKNGSNLFPCLLRF